MNNNEFSKQEIIKTMNQLDKSEKTTEVRIFNTRYGTVSGYFDDFKSLAKAVEPYNGEHSIYITLNPVNPALIARSENRLQTYAETTTSDRDIIKRKWFPIDLDSKRPSGISATDKEHQAALDLAKKIKEELTDRGWPQPIYASSGNGAHLLFKIDMKNDEKSKNMVKKVLETLDWKYSNPQVDIDTSPHNAGRIWKLYGTIACKGDNTNERPYRKAEIISYPEEIEILKKDKLETFIKDLPQELKDGNNINVGDGFAGSAASAGKLDLKKWIEEHNLDIVKSGRWNNKADRYILGTCPWNEDHTDNSAYIIKFDGGGIAAGCHHDSCSQKNWQSLRKKLEPDYQPITEEYKNTKKNYSNNGKKKKKQADLLIDITDDIEVFKDDLGEAFAVISLENHHEIWPIESKKFELWLSREYFKKIGSVPGSEAINQAIGIMRANAEFASSERKLYRRIGKNEKAFYYDLVDDAWQAVKIAPGICEIEDNPPQIFTRNKNMSKQVKPDFSGDFSKILDHVHLKDEDNQIIYQVYLISCLIPEIPHPVLILHGEKGSAKSTTMRMTRTIVDPARQNLFSLPTDMKSMVITMRNNYMTTFDNLQKLPTKKSDLICMAATGGAFSTRKLYTNSEDFLMEFKRCIVLNGINVVATQADLIDRSILLELNRISKNNRKEEKIIWEEFEKNRPEIIGGGLQALAKAMEIYPDVELEQLGRMADFTRWGYAIAEALGLGGERFIQAYFKNQNQSNQEVIESNPVAKAVIKFMEDKNEWSGLVSALLDKLEKVAKFNRINIKSNLWPGSASVLTRRLKEVKSNLEDIGIFYNKRKEARGKIITIENENCERKILEYPKNQTKDKSQDNNKKNGSSTKEVPANELKALFK